MNSASFVISVSEQLAKNEPHLTLEFLSELVVGFQQHSPALKQLCLSYMSPWIPNLSKFVARTEGITEQEKVVKLIDLFVSLTISEEEVSHLSESCDTSCDFAATPTVCHVICMLFCTDVPSNPSARVEEGRKRARLAEEGLGHLYQGGFDFSGYHCSVG